MEARPCLAIPASRTPLRGRPPRPSTQVRPARSLTTALTAPGPGLGCCALGSPPAASSSWRECRRRWRAQAAGLGLPQRPLPGPPGPCPARGAQGALELLPAGDRAGPAGCGDPQPRPWKRPRPRRVQTAIRTGSGRAIPVVESARTPSAQGLLLRATPDLGPGRVAMAPDPALDRSQPWRGCFGTACAGPCAADPAADVGPAVPRGLKTGISWPPCHLHPSACPALLFRRGPHPACVYSRLRSSFVPKGLQAPLRGRG